MRACLAVMVVSAGVASARAELALFAQYDWQDVATDVSGSPIQHDGALDFEASVVGGKLILDGDGGVQLGHVPELDGATEVLFRFEDVTFTRPFEVGYSNTASLVGDGYGWSVDVYRENFGSPSVQTELAFALREPGQWDGLDVHISDQVVNHFDSIEYRLNGTAPLSERFSIRFDDGPWVTGGVGDDAFGAIPRAEAVRINSGIDNDGDPIYATLGTVSFYSNQIPEPTTLGLALAGLTAILACRWWRCRRT